MDLRLRTGRLQTHAPLSLLTDGLQVRAVELDKVPPACSEGAVQVILGALRPVVELIRCALGYGHGHRTRDHRGLFYRHVRAYRMSSASVVTHLAVAAARSQR